MTVEIIITKDLHFDGKWIAHWPSEIVAQGLSAGAGRHDTRTRLIAAIEERGWTVSPSVRDRWTATKDAA